MVQRQRQRLLIAGVTGALMLTPCSKDDVATAGAAAPAPPPSVAHPERWPTPTHALAADEALEARVESLLRTLTIEEKVGQIIQADIASVTPQDVRDYHLG